MMRWKVFQTCLRSLLVGCIMVAWSGHSVATASAETGDQRELVVTEVARYPIAHDGACYAGPSVYVQSLTWLTNGSYVASWNECEPGCNYWFQIFNASGTLTTSDSLRIEEYSHGKCP